jgi:hypothetical protein
MQRPENYLHVAATLAAVFMAGAALGQGAAKSGRTHRSG